MVQKIRKMHPRLLIFLTRQIQECVIRPNQCTLLGKVWQQLDSFVADHHCNGVIKSKSFLAQIKVKFGLRALHFGFSDIVASIPSKLYLDGQKQLV